MLAAAMTVSTHAALQPALDAERHVILDVLRGFALYGVLLANLVWLTSDMVLTDARLRQLPTAAVDPIARAFVAFFIDGKFYTLFSFLFGLGFALQLQRAEVRGTGIVRVYVRRLLALAVIGVVHIALIWYGDILLWYASLGFVLLLFRGLRPRLWLVILALALALGTRPAFTTYQMLTSSPQTSSTAADAEQETQTKEARLAAFQSGYPRVVRENVATYWHDVFVEGVISFALPLIFARFLLGLYAGKKRLAEQAPECLPHAWRALPCLIVVALIGNTVGLIHRWLEHERGIELSDSWWLVATIPVYEAGVLALSSVYVCVICLLFFRTTRWQKRLARLARVGRMALTNYLTHSVLYLVLFTGAGLGLIGSVGPAICVALSLLIFSAQVILSDWWLRHYRFGPVEWVWRSLTYGQVQPMKRSLGTVGTGSL
jgi:uncharacterized protein